MVASVGISARSAYHPAWMTARLASYNVASKKSGASPAGSAARALNRDVSSSGVRVGSYTSLTYGFVRTSRVFTRVRKPSVPCDHDMA